MLRIAVALSVLAALTATQAGAGGPKNYTCTTVNADGDTVQYKCSAKRYRPQEEAAEAAAYQKMLKEREEHKTTTEHCYYVNGKLDCKPAP